MNRAFLLLWAEAATDPELAPIFRERDEAFRADLRADVRAGLADGTIRPDVTRPTSRSRLSGSFAASGCSGCSTRPPWIPNGCARPSPSTGAGRLARRRCNRRLDARRRTRGRYIRWM